MNKRIKQSLWTFFVVASFMLGTAVHAQEEEVAKLEFAINDAMQVIYDGQMTDDNFAQKATKVRAVLEENYDLMVIIRRTIGRNWKLLSPAEQVQIKELVTKLVVKAFVQGLQGVERPTIQFGEFSLITDKRLEVLSTVLFSDGKTFSITYRLGRTRTGWQIYDILAEDVSIVANYRRQIDDHFRKGTGAELIEKLETLLAKESLNEKTAKL